MPPSQQVDKQIYGHFLFQRVAYAIAAWATSLLSYLAACALHWMKNTEEAAHNVSSN